MDVGGRPATSLTKRLPPGLPRTPHTLDGCRCLGHLIRAEEREQREDKTRRRGGREHGGCVRKELGRTWFSYLHTTDKSSQMDQILQIQKGTARDA